MSAYWSVVAGSFLGGIVMWFVAYHCGYRRGLRAAPLNTHFPAAVKQPQKPSGPVTYTLEKGSNVWPSLG